MHLLVALAGSLQCEETCAWCTTLDLNWHFAAQRVKVKTQPDIQLYCCDWCLCVPTPALLCLYCNHFFFFLLKGTVSVNDANLMVWTPGFSPSHWELHYACLLISNWLFFKHGKKKLNNNTKLLLATNFHKYIFFCIFNTRSSLELLHESTVLFQHCLVLSSALSLSLWLRLCCCCFQASYSLNSVYILF